MNTRKMNKFNTFLKLKGTKNILLNQIFSFDFETILVNDIHIVTCFSIYSLNYETVESLDTIDINNSDLKEKSQELLKKFINYLKNIKSSHKNCIFICHNFGKFDSAFIIEFCCNQNIPIDLISRNNTIYRVSILLDKTKIELQDSYLMFPTNLNLFCEAMHINAQKINFDFDKHKYSQACINDLKFYCLNDSKILYQSYIKLQNSFFKDFQIDISKSLTFSSIAMKIFLTHFYDENKKPIQRTEGRIDAFIRKSYFGGITEVYKPFMEKGFCYDVNSLYPSCMLENDFPIGPGEWVNPENIDINNFFGFAHVEVFCPAIYRPILAMRNEDDTLILPTGSFSGIYFSEEIKLCLKYGYTFKFTLAAIKYEKGKLFEDYVMNLYNKRISSKEKTNNLFYKFLLNALYGRFGMSPDYNQTIVTNDKYTINKILTFHETKSFNSIGDTEWTRINYNKKISKEYVKRNMNFTEENINYTCEHQNKNQFSLSSSAVQIASAITSYARIKMFYYKNKIPENDLAYTDTDSLFTTTDLSEYVSDKIGFLKLEFNIENAYFIAPKLYYVKTTEGTEVIKNKGIQSNILNERFFKNVYENIENEAIPQIFLFKRDIKNFIIYKEKTHKTMHYIFLKRTKVFNENKNWIDTKPLEIKKN